MANTRRKLVGVTSTKSENSESHAEAIATPNDISEELIASRAYEKWQERGCPLWDDERDWFAARAEFEQQRASSGQAAANDAA